MGDLIMDIRIKEMRGVKLGQECFFFTLAHSWYLFSSRPTEGKESGGNSNTGLAPAPSVGAWGGAASRSFAEALKMAAKAASVPTKSNSASTTANAANEPSSKRKRKVTQRYNVLVLTLSIYHDNSRLFCHLSYVLAEEEEDQKWWCYDDGAGSASEKVQSAFDFRLNGADAQEKYGADSC